MSGSSVGASNHFSVGRQSPFDPTWIVDDGFDTPGPSLAEKITREASKQTFYTIRLLADRPLVAGAYRAYAYFRWVDDVLDQELALREDRLAFLARQQMIIDRCYQGDKPLSLRPEEGLLCDLIDGDWEENSGLRTYINQMMAVMAFDARRKGLLISHAELNEYTCWLATAVTEALHYFIGHDGASPLSEARYQAVTAAHVTHMLRDAVEDAQNGYNNIPRDYLQLRGISPSDVNSAAYRDWVKGRVKLARERFASGRAYLAQVESRRCRLAGYAYTARFELILDAIEREGYQLRAAYPERKSKRAVLKIGMIAVSQFLQSLPGAGTRSPSGSVIIKGITQ